ncbi:MAG TPA: histidine phosphatase family protein [Aeromicrobium sp.]|nr:histidine phosphatase family protein [Aeromicrobium sp.]
MTRTVIVWRHGRTAWNLAGRVQGLTDVPLDEVGREQAREAAARLASLRPSRIVTSDLSRARETADELGRLTGVTVETDARLRERSFGVREGLTMSEAWEQLPEHMARWAAGDEAGIPGSESSAAAGERFTSALEDHLQDLGQDETLVVVAHGGVTRVGILTFLGFPRDTWESFGGLSNCAWTVLEEGDLGGTGLRWRVIEWNAGTLPEPVLSDEEPG